MSQDLDRSFGRETVSPEERQRRIRDLFDRVAKRYDLMNDMMSFGIHRLWKRSFVRGLPRTGLVVDLAGGTGDVAVLAARETGRQVVVCDPSLEMMAVGRDRHGDEALAWIGGEGERLPFADGSVAALTVAFGLRNVTHLEHALTEAHRVLQPGGQFACLEFSRPWAWFRPSTTPTPSSSFPGSAPGSPTSRAPTSTWSNPFVAFRTRKPSPPCCGAAASSTFDTATFPWASPASTAPRGSPRPTPGGFTSTPWRNSPRRHHSS